MEKCLFFLAFLTFQIVSSQAGFSVGGGISGGVGGGISGGVGGFYIGGGGGISTQTPPSTSTPPQTSNLKTAYTVLQTWKSSISDDPLGVLKTWVGYNVCSYKGVFCADPQEQYYDDEQISSKNSEEITQARTKPQVLAGIDLNNANLEGILVKELSLLTDMSLFHINSNRFTGNVPESFRNLFSLQELDLSNNHFSGSFPYATIQIPNLIYLDLRFNNFSGPIPDDIFNKNLDAIFLNNNQFSGEIPTNLGNSPASVINLANNYFTGTIPTSFGFMGSKLKEILFLNNQLTGCIPQGFGILSQVQVMDLSFNSLMGHLPDTLSCLNEIEVLNLAHNKLSGELPDLVCSLKSLMNLSVAYNFFSGFSSECNKLFFRNVGFDFDLNCIPGRNMQRPQPECSIVPGGGLSCLRIPSVPLVCG